MKIKIILGLTAFTLLAGIIGTIDINTYNGIHSVTGYAANNKIIVDNGNTYSASNLEGKVKVTLDNNGNVIEITSQNQRGK